MEVNNIWYVKLPRSLSTSLDLSLKVTGSVCDGVHDVVTFLMLCVYVDSSEEARSLTPVAASFQVNETLCQFLCQPVV